MDDDQAVTTRTDEQTGTAVRVPQQRGVQHERSTPTTGEGARRSRTGLWAGAGIAAAGAVAALVFYGVSSGDESSQGPAGSGNAEFARQLPCHPGLACAW